MTNNKPLSLEVYLAQGEQPSAQEEQLMLPFQLESLSAEDQAKRGWELAVNGETVNEVTAASLKHPKMGIEVTYGKRPEGYDGFVIREPGGAATIPYTVDENGNFYVGLVKESRPTMGEALTSNIPRGFSDFGETKEETATRELKEETGYATLGRGLIKLAEGLNPNSTFFDYSHAPDEGVSIFAVRVGTDQLELDHDESGHVSYTFPATIRDQAEGDKAAERILGSVFVPLTEALKSRDMFTSAAAGQLIAHLLSEGEYIVPQISSSK